MGRRRYRPDDGQPTAHLPAHRGGGAGLSRRRRPERLAGLVDSHCHLQDARFDADLDAVIARATEAGIERIMVPGWDLPSSDRALELADRHAPMIQAAVGIHPHYVADANEHTWSAIEALAANPRCSAVGEIGLDFFRNLSPPDAQREAFERQLTLAADRSLPVIVHDRDAHDEISRRLSDWAKRHAGRPHGVLHAFSGDAAMARALVGEGFVISFALPVAFRSAHGPREAARDIPAGSYLVETDAPYLGPDREGRNEPTTTLRVAAELAAIRNTSPEAVSLDVRQAYERLIGT